MEDREKIEMLIDELYTYYEGENSFQLTRYLHPMFQNGTFSENNSYQPPKPKKLMTREEFVSKMSNESEEYRWNTALQVLFNHISKQK